MNFIVQRSMESSPLIIHIDRLSRFHGTDPTKWKKVVTKENAALNEDENVSKYGRKCDIETTHRESE